MHPLRRLHDRLEIEEPGEFKFGLRKRMASAGVRVANAVSDAVEPDKYLFYGIFDGSP